MDRQPRRVLGRLRQPAVAEVVVGLGGVAVPGLEQRHHELLVVGAEVVDGGGRAGLRRHLGHVVGHRVHARLRDRQVAGEDLPADGVVGVPLDVGVAPFGVDAAAGPADVAEQQLDEADAPDDLHPGDVVGETDGIDDAADLLRHAGGAEHVGDLGELVHRHAGDLGDLLRCVAGVVGLHQREDAAGVLQGRIGLGVGHRRRGRRLTAGRRRRAARRRPGRRAERLSAARGSGRLSPGLCRSRRRPGRQALVVPRGRVVGPLRLVVAREQPVVELVALGHDERGVGVQLDVVLVVQLVLEDVVDEPPEEGDVGAGPDRGVDVGDRRGAGEAGVDVDDLCAALIPSDVGPLPAAGVVLGGVGPDDEDRVRVLEVAPVVGHGAPAEGGGQTGHRGAVSNAGLLL